MRTAFKKTKRAFTLIEMIAAVGIVSILMCLLLPVMAKGREAAESQKSSSNLRQIGVALLAYSGEHEGLFPIAGGAIPYGRVDSQTQLGSWQEQLETYLGNDRRIFRTSRTLEMTNQIYSYFLGCRAAMEEANGFSALRLNRIQKPSSYVLAGEVNGQWFARHDADRDNYTQDPAFGDNVRLPGGYVVCLFADGHVNRAKSFDPATMTYSYEPAPAP